MSSSRPWRPARQLLGLPAYHARLAGLAFRSTNNHHHPCYRHLSRAGHAGHGPSFPASARPLSARPLLGRPGPSPLPRTRPLRLRPAALSQTLPKVGPLLRLILPWPTPSQCGTFFSHFLLLLLGSRACPCADDPSRRLRLQRLSCDAATLVTLPVPSPAQTRTVLCSPTPLLARPADSWICRLRPTLASSPPAHECQPYARAHLLCLHSGDTCCFFADLDKHSSPSLQLPTCPRPLYKLLPALSPLARKEPPLPIDQTRPQSLPQDAGVAERHTLF